MDTAPLWNVEKVQDDTILDSGTGIVPAKRVIFTTASGQRSYITMPASEFTKEKVQKLVHDAATEIEAVVAMSGPPVVQGMVEYTDMVPSAVANTGY